MTSTAPTAAENYPEKRGFEKRRKLDHEAGTAPPRTGLPPPPTPQCGPHDGRYHYDMYGMPVPMRYPYDDGHYREPPSMPYARGHPAPSPKHPHGPHPGYAYPPPPPPKEYYHNSYHMPDYPPPPPGWSGHHPPPHAYHHHAGSAAQPFSPRFSQPYEYDRHYATEPNAPRSKPSPTTANGDGSYQSPTSVVNSLDTRSPEGSRNLNNFEERVGDGVPPASQMAPYHVPPQPYYPQPIHSPASAHPPAHTSRQWWSCDYCSYKFSSWEECSAHESMCPSRTHHPHHSLSSKKRGPDSIAAHHPHHHHEESRFMEPHEEYAHNTDRPTFSLAQPLDGQSLSDRQCYVRTHFVELFVATEADVSARHSRGAQKLHLNQVGLRCAYCAKLKPRDRAERAVCYPSSISRIYQTVADMQRFHFEACSAIPAKVLRVYKSLKTTRPRGVGSPQSYWDKSARELGLVDSEFGIMLKDGGARVLVRNAVDDGAGVGTSGVAPIPSLTNVGANVSSPAVNVSREEGTAEDWEESDGHGSSSARDDAQERAHAPCSEADASILLMLKNPEATSSPKSADEAVPKVTEV